MDQQTPHEGLTALLKQLYDMSPSDVSESDQLRALRTGRHDRREVLSSIPATSRPSHRPLHLLYTLLSEYQGPWPPLSLLRCYTRLYKSLPEEAKVSPSGELASLINNTSKLVKGSYRSLSDFIGCNSRPALRTAKSHSFITHQGLHDFTTSFCLPTTAAGGRPVVAVALPGGPLLAATCIAVTTYYTAAPINPTAGPQQFRADVTQVGAKIILTTTTDYEKLQLGGSWVRSAGIEVFCMDWDCGDRIDVVTPAGEALPDRVKTRTPNRADDVGLVLVTSGTSGTRKVVPLKLHSIIAGVVFVMESWSLTSEDICLNMMPLYHVGGLIRNIFAPIFSGGSTVCCAAFDPNLFWDIVEDIQPTWYYASPTMHSMILAQALERPLSVRRSRIRLACNAAGDLLPSLALQLRDTFNCIVLPSYGMTECMPISTPPLDYRLDRDGSSGVSTGPELTILNCSEAAVSSGTVGRICVRGEPVFPGYLLPDGSFDRAPFNADGWFDTGDLGYMDDDGYLYITGRSKEVINRGGELISPFEVENAIMSAAIEPGSLINGRVSQALAFSASHDMLQEVVAVALVTPTNVARIDLKTLHSALRSSLQQVKWPVLITYMDDLPRRNNKLLRINFGQRLGLPKLSDDLPYLQRHWHASCPPPDTAISVPIQSWPCSIDHELVSRTLDASVPAGLSHYYHGHATDDAVDVYLAPAKPGSIKPQQAVASKLRQHLSSCLHNYMVPTTIHLMPEALPTDEHGKVDEARLRCALDELLAASQEKLLESTEGKVIKAFADVLARHPGDVQRDVDFFSLGGDSLRAGRLASVLRSTFNIELPISIIFTQGTIQAISRHIDRGDEAQKSPLEDDEDGEDRLAACTKTHSSTRPILMALQLVPLAILHPLRRAFQWSVFLGSLGYAKRWPTHSSVPGRLVNVLLCIMFSRHVVRCVAPLVGIAAKWLIMGRYREGLYPMWGCYHTRWWMTQKIISICGKGFFGFNESTERIYHRLMGARIGKNVKLVGVALGEWDLLDIRDGAALTRCVCRPFAAEGNTTMYLGKIVIGENSSIGVSSVIAAGSNIAPNTCIGPNSSSWEAGDADEANRHLSPSRVPQPHWLLTCLLTAPLTLVAWALSLLPWAGGLVGMVLRGPSNSDSSLRDVLAWFTAAERVAYHSLAMALRSLLRPLVLLAFAVLVRIVLDAVLGKLGSSPVKGRSAVATWRAALMQTLMPVERLHDATAMFGQHYEATSTALRLLGSKVGKRVYWPGTGPDIGDYHLLDVGNDVVFGSYSYLITSDGIGSEKITIRDRAMIADRVCLLPGVDIGERATMGSGALTRRGKRYAAGSTFVGSSGGDAVCLSPGCHVKREKQCAETRSRRVSSDDTLTGWSGKKQPVQRAGIQHMESDDTLAESRKPSPKRPCQTTADTSMASDSHSPFGRAFYLKLAPYRVLGPSIVFCYSASMTVLTALYWDMAMISSVQLVHLAMNRFVARRGSVWIEALALYSLSSITVALLTTLQAVLALAIVIAAKWAILGRRQPGNYDWDKSSYCQRWQMFLCIERLRCECYNGQGILGLLTGTSWLVLYFRAMGARIGKDCALFASGNPNLMFTEPDLMTLGDRVVVDDASVVAHINSRGSFSLNRLEIGHGCVLRTGSRLLSGATMERNSCLLEHTLVMGGDVVAEGCTMQGWPARRFMGRRVR